MINRRLVLFAHAGLGAVLLLLVLPASLLGYLPSLFVDAARPVVVLAVAYAALGVPMAVAAQIIQLVPRLRARVSETDLATIHFVSTQSIAIAVVAWTLVY